jgi:phosphate transport system permease protein
VSAPTRPTARRRIQRLDALGDRVLHGVCLAAAAVAAIALGALAYHVLAGAWPAISRFGPGFVVSGDWEPTFDRFGAGTMLFGTAVSGFMALLLAAPLGILIGLYVAMFAPRPMRAVVGPLVELLAAIPSVILGFWGILVLSPFVRDRLEPTLHERLGFLPIFGAPQTTGSSMFTAGLILTIMVVPIVASLSRDLFLSVPQELQDGAAALGATRWEIVRGVVLPTTASGITAAVFLGLGRALGEAIAVTQVIGAGSATHASLFLTADTLASRIAAQFQNATTVLHTASLFYLGAILLVLGVASNLLAQWIGRRFDGARALAA